MSMKKVRLVLVEMTQPSATKRVMQVKEVVNSTRWQIGVLLPVEEVDSIIADRYPEVEVVIRGKGK
jgi:hypothetical protein